MVAVIRHTMISIKEQHGVLVHGLNHVLNDRLCLYNFPFNLGMIGIESVPGMIDAKQVADQQVEVAGVVHTWFFEDAEQISVHIPVVGVQISDVEGRVVLLLVEVEAHHVKPDVVAGEHHFFVLACCIREVLDLVENIVFWDKIVREIFFDFKKGRKPAS